MFSTRSRFGFSGTYLKSYRINGVLGLLLTAGLLLATPAGAAYEQVDNFAGTPGVLHPFGYTEWPEEVQLSGVGGMAVNYTGAGGVPAGTVYAATWHGEGEARIARFNPDGSFSESWSFTEAPGFKERCGPDGEPAHPACKSRPSASASPVDVEVNQSTGYVYIFDGVASAAAGSNRIHVYSADGSELITEFGELAASSETTAASPAEIHGTSGTGGIAVDGSGTVYVNDSNGHESYHRLMVFEPQEPGDYEHYVYAGQSKDILPAFFDFGDTIVTEYPVADAAGNLYVAENFDGGIVKLDPSKPAGPPLCEFHFAKSHLKSITVNPLTGEVFFYSDTDRTKIRRLGPACNEGKFTELEPIPYSPKRVIISGLAFDPVAQLDPSRPPGVLYAGAPESEGGKTEGEHPDTLAEASMGYVFSRPPALPPEVGAESVAHVTATAAQLHAQINPKGSQTNYTFQFLTEAEYEANEPADRFAGAREAPLGGGEIAGGQKAIDAFAGVAGLLPDTAYRYRAVVVSHCSAEEPEKVCEGTGEAASFRTFPVEAPGLPDERAWELVSPAQKNGGEVFPANPDRDSCPTVQCKPEPGLRFPMQSSPDGEAIVYQGQPFAHSGTATNENEYISRRDPKAGWQTTSLSPRRASRGSGQGYSAFSDDLSQGLLFQIDPALSPEAPSGYANLYAQPSANPLQLDPALRAGPPNRPGGIGSDSFRMEYAGASADLSRIFFAANDALTEETPFAPEAQDPSAGKRNLYEWHEGQLSLVNVLPGNAEAKVALQVAASQISRDGSRAFFEDEASQLYVREDAEETRAIPGPGKFLAASLDGSKVLFSDGHVYDLDAESSTDLTEGKGGFQGLSGQSEDLSRLYFVDTEVLDEAANAQGAKAEEGKFNLYSWVEGQGTRYVATLVAGDNSPGASDWSVSPSGGRTAQAGSDGRYLTFLSVSPLTGYDNVGFCKAPAGGVGKPTFGSPCQEVFLYDSQEDELICASCNRSGAPPLGGSYLPRVDGGFLTSEGRLYFDSLDSLVASDTNDGVEDVYEYEPNGIGSCKQQAGCVSLISAGHGALDSNLLAIDRDGENVFFTSRDQLVLKDHDDAIDLYVAREKGGIPAESEVSRGECQGEACLPLAALPNRPTPATAALAGDGNVEEGKRSEKHRKRRRHAKKHRHHKRAAKHNRGGSK